MITLITVLLEPLEQYFENYFLQNVQKKTKHVDEILVAKVDTNKDFKLEKNLGAIKYTKFGCPIGHLMGTSNKHPGIQNSGIQHAIGLHACLEKAKNDLVLLTDPDVLFYDKIDEIYLDLFETHKLNLIGCSHKYGVEYACTYYPNQINMMFRKSDLPDTSFLDDDLVRRPFKITDAPLDSRPFPGKWLIPGPIPKYVDMFPNKEGYFETGCNIYILGQRQNWKWLSFQTIDCVTYTTKYRRCNFKPLPNVKKTKLLYHMNNSWSIALELENITLHNAIPSGMMAKERYNQFVEEFETISSEEE